jgi:CRISPR-associated endoribonuclease Cas6
MPYNLIIPVNLESMWQPGFHEQRAMHAVFLQALNAVDAALSASVHEARLKPFAQALVAGEREALSWRVSLLDDALYAPFCEGIKRLRLERVGNRPFALDVDGMQTNNQSYAALAETATAARYQVAFYTPTTFKQRYYYQPLPNPYLCFQSWWGRWQQFAPPELSWNIALLDVVQAHLVVSYFRLHSELVQDGKRAYVGATGKMTFAPLQAEKVAAHWWQGVSALGAYANFCGTGHKTTQGMGHTEVQTKQ